MTTDDSAAITGLIVVGVVLTTNVGYVLTRPTDLRRTADRPSLPTTLIVKCLG